MHVAERQSIPNLPAGPAEAAGLPHTIAFDSLKSLPHRDYLQPHYESQQQPPGVLLCLTAVLCFAVSCCAVLCCAVLCCAVPAVEHLHAVCCTLQTHKGKVYVQLL